VSRALKSLGIFAAIVIIYTISRHAVNDKTVTTSTSTTTTSIVAPTTTTTKAATTATTCVGSDFTGVYVEGEGAAGTISASITLTKSTAGSCTLKGWPILSLQDTTGAVMPSTMINERPGDAPIQFPAAQANQAPALLSLAQGDKTSFSLAYSDVPTGSAACPSARTVSVQFAKNGSVATVTPSSPIAPCNNGTIWVSPFY
jgi:hypothetical protein